jgi:hypothetical protein
MSIPLRTRAYHAAQPLRKATLCEYMSGPELVLPGTAMRPSCHMNYMGVTSCRVTVRPRTRSVLRALRHLPRPSRYSERMNTSHHQRTGEHGPDILIVDSLGGNQPHPCAGWTLPDHRERGSD